MQVAQLSFTFEPAPRAHREGALHSFFANNSTTLAEAISGEGRAEAQTAVVLQFFRDHPGRWTPSEVANQVNRKRAHAWSLNGIRRAITVLTEREELQHHKSDRQPGPFGSLESKWSLC